MVAEDAYVVAEHVHQRVLHVAFEILEIQRALHHIAGIDEDYVLFRFPHAVYDGFALQHASPPVLVGVDERMRVVGVEYHEVFGTRRERDAEHYGRCGLQEEMSVVHVCFPFFRRTDRPQAKDSANVTK